MTKREQIIETTIQFIKKTKTYPMFRDLRAEGISDGAVRYSFGNLAGLFESLRKVKPKFFKGVRRQGEIEPSSSEIKDVFKRMGIK